MRVLTVGVVLAALSFTETDALAQNADPFFFGDEAALASGAVVASGRDAGSFWYNPAGFGGLQRGLVSASASTFGVRIRHVPDALRLTVGGATTGNALSSVDVISVPNALVAATQLGDRFTVAGGLLTTQRDLRSGLVDVDESLRTTLAGEQILAAQRVDVQTDTSKYHFGGAFAAELAKDLRVGGAVYGTYTKLSLGVQSALSLRDAARGTAFVLASTRQTRSAFGVSGAIGAQYDVTRAVSVGLTVRAPELALTQTSEGGAAIGISASGGNETPFSNLQRSDLAGSPSAGVLVAPTRILFGVAYALGPPQSYVEVGADFAHGLPKSEIADAQQPAVNARVGVRYMLSPEWIVGGGLFSDRATIRKVGFFVTGDKIDWYGLTAGVSKRTPLSLSENPSPEALVLVTTLSLRAGLGTGTATAVGFNVDNTGNPDIRSDVMFYEIMPYLGSAVLFR